MLTRRIMTTGLAAGAASLLSSCGTIIYPDRVNQEERGDLDVLVLGMDAVGLLFFLVPGIIAFVVDFGTGAIYFPEDHKKGDRERTIFDQINSQEKLDQPEIEHLVSKQIGADISLERNGAQVMRINQLDQFWMAKYSLSSGQAITVL